MPKSEIPASQRLRQGSAAPDSQRSAPGWTGRAGRRPEVEPVAPAAPESTAVRPVPETAAGRLVADHREAVPLRGARGLVGWVVFGLGVAAALVAAAVLLRPESVTPVGKAPRTAATASAPAAVAPSRIAPESSTGAGAVRFRVGPDVDPETIARLSAALNGEGYGEALVEQLSFSIAQSRVGYYRPEDKAAAEALAAFVSPLIGDAEVVTRNYGDLLADTEPGRLDLWLGG